MLSTNEIQNLVKHLMAEYGKTANRFKEDGDKENSWYFSGGERALSDLLGVIKKPELFKNLLNKANLDIPA